MDPTLSPPLSGPAADEKSKGATGTEPYIHLGNPSDDFLDIFSSTGMMAGTGSPSPYIKDEPDDLMFGSPHPQSFVAHASRGFGGAAAGHHHHHHPQHRHPNQPDANLVGALGQSHGSDASVDPAELTMQGESLPTHPGAFTPSFPSFGAPQSMTFHLGNSGIADDELLDLGNLNDADGSAGGFRDPDDFFAGAGSHPAHAPHGHPDPSSSLPHHFHDRTRPAGAMTVNASSHLSAQLYSPGPDGGAAVSPFAHPHATYEHVPPAPVSRQASYGHPSTAPLASSYGGPARPHPTVSNPTLDQRTLHAAARARAQAQAQAQGHPSFDRNASHPRSPLTPKTPSIGLGGMTLGMPDSGSFPQPIHTQHLAQHHRGPTGFASQWDGQAGSLHSYVDSPLSSPGRPSHHPQISDVLSSGKPASLPAKVENGRATGPGASLQSQEAKRRRRRESHNLVERRRRDNINERIQELSHLVPAHRLEDERVRKHLLNNSPLSPSLGPLGMSPPQATSLLAGGAGRRATSSLGAAIPVEDKDKGPNKGDILNGSVSWTRDLMWALHAKIQQESELAQYITSLGGTFPFEPTEEERRMRTELLDAMEKNDPSTFSYSRAPGSGLRVPKHTNLAGEPLGGSGPSSSSMSPGNLSGGSRTASLGQGHGPFMSGPSSGGSGQNSVGFKEEDEYSMDMS